MAPWCLFDSFNKKTGYIDVALEHLLLEATSEGLRKKKLYLIVGTNLRSEVLVIYTASGL